MEIDAKVGAHLDSLYKEQSFGDEISIDDLKQSWVEKEKLFVLQTNNLKMDSAETAEKDGSAFLALTYSGSLLAVFCPDGGKRKIEYASIKLRNDVPDLLSEEPKLVKDVEKGKSAQFSGGRLENTSALYQIALFDSSVKPEEQNKRLTEAMVFLTNSFVKINRTLMQPKTGAVDHFTKKSMTTYLARKHALTQDKVKNILEDFTTLIESGVMMGERVPLGKIGKLYADKRAPQKARIGRNPSTGEEITIAAQPACMVAKSSFSSAFKEKVKSMPVED